MAASTLSLFAGEHAVSASVIDRALTLNPNSAHAWAAYGYVLCYRNQPGPAIVALQRAMRLNPLDRLGRAFTAGIALAHLVAGRYEEAVEWSDRSLREEPGYRGALRIKVVACAHLDRMEEAGEGLRRLLDTLPGLTIIRLKTFGARVVSPELLAVFVEGFRKAGLSEE